MTNPLGRKQSIELQLLSAGHFAANLNLPTGPVSFTVNATSPRGQRSRPASPSRSRNKVEAMHHPPNRTRISCLALAALAVVLLGACSSGGGPTSTPAPATLVTRPSSTAKLSILAPRNGQTISRRASEVHLGLAGAKIVSHTTTRVQPDQGHIHLLVDGKLVAMNYGLDERLPNLTPGQHLVQVEFVAADHAPFDPRVLTQAAFTVKP
jgi:hypothetical protein